MADDFVVEGMTMPVVNDAFVILRSRYSALVRRMELHTRVKQQMLYWRARYDNQPTYGCTSVPGYVDTLALSEEQVAAVTNAATYVAKPPAVIDERNQTIRTQLLTALDAAVAPTSDEFARRGIVAPAVVDDVRRVAVANVVERVTARFRAAVLRYDWSDTPLTAEELQTVFGEYIAGVPDDVRRRVAAEEFRAAFGEYVAGIPDDVQRRVYVRATIEAAPVTRMMAWLAPLGDLVTDDIKENVATRVYGSYAAFRAPNPVPLVDAEARDATLKTTAERTAEFMAAVRDTIELELNIAGLWLGADAFDTDTRARLVYEAAERERSVDPTEEALVTRRVRFMSVADAVQREADVQLARVRYELAKPELQPVVHVPLVIERDELDRAPLTFRVRLVAKGGAVDAGDAAHTFELVRVGDEADRLAAATTGVGEQPEATLSTKDVRAGGYYVRVGRRVGAATTTFVSATATVRLFATCVRCEGTRFESTVGRRFGECLWRTRPLNEAALKLRRSLDAAAAPLDFTPLAINYTPAYDDSVRELETDTLLLDDESIANLAIVAPDTLRARYFTYEAIVRNIARRVGARFRVELEAVIDAVDEPELLAAVRSARSLEQLPLDVVLRATAGHANALKARQSERRFLGALRLHLRSFARLLVPPTLGTMTAADVRVSEAWSSSFRRLRLAERLTPISMFIDIDGEAHLRARIAAVRARYDQRHATMAWAESKYTRETTLVRKELDAYERTGAPLGVPLDVWTRLEADERARADRAQRIYVSPLREADWRGMHSATNDQPDVYAASVRADGTLALARGSERLYTGFDFAGLHALIEAAATAHATATPAARPPLAARVDRLILYFNVLAQCAPILHSRAQLQADELVERLDALYATK